MKYEFKMLDTPIPWNEYFKHDKNKSGGVLWKDDVVVAIAYVNGNKFARVILDLAKQKELNPTVAEQAVKELVDEVKKKHPFPSTNFDDDDDDDDVPTATLRKSSIPADPEKLYYIQHEDDYLTPFISYAASIDECKARCKEAATKYLKFVKTHHAYEVLDQGPGKQTTKTEDILNYLKAGWVFQYHSEIKGSVKWTARYPSLDFSKDGSYVVTAGQTWLSAMHKGLDFINKQLSERKEKEAKDGNPV